MEDSEPSTDINQNLDIDVHKASGFLDIVSFVEKNLVSDDDPMLLLSFNRDGLAQFVQRANFPNANYPLPTFAVTNRENITVRSFIQDIYRHSLTSTTRIFQAFAGADILYGPNTAIQFGNIASFFSSVCYDPWVVAIVTNGQKIQIGKLMCITESTKPLKFEALDPHTTHSCCFAPKDIV